MFLMKKKCFEIPEKFRTRILLMLFGIVIQGMGLSLLMKVNLGIDPYATCLTGISNHLSISFGTVYLLIQIILMLFVISNDISQIGFGTIGNMFLLGYLTDFFSWLFQLMIPSYSFGYPTIRYVTFVPALILLLLGAALYISSGLGVGPYDAIPIMINNRFPKISFRIIRMIWDTFFMISGVLLGSKVGLVTIGIALFAGAFISAVKVRIEKVLA